MDKDRYFSSISLGVFAERSGISIFEERSPVIISKSGGDKLSVDSFLDGGDECSLGVGTVFMIDDGHFILHIQPCIR